MLCHGPGSLVWVEIQGGGVGFERGEVVPYCSSNFLRFFCDHSFLFVLCHFLCIKLKFNSSGIFKSLGERKVGPWEGKGGGGLPKEPHISGNRPARVLHSVLHLKSNC